MEYETSISKINNDDFIVRGEKISSLIKDSTFSDSIFLIIKGEKPSKIESKIFNSILISSIDHGMGTASSMASRFVASAGNPLNSAVSAGILALGNRHGGAVTDCMEQLKSVTEDNVEEFVKNNLTNKKLIYGFGHKFHKDKDPRVHQLIDFCKEINFPSNFIKIALKIEKEIEKQKGKKLILNIDGIIAALLSEMNFTPSQGNGIFIIARTPGLVAHAIEEKETNKSVRRIAEEEIKFKSQ